MVLRLDRDYNIVMTDCNNDCVYIFNKEGEERHRIGKGGQGIGEFYYPYGVAIITLDVLLLCVTRILPVYEYSNLFPLNLK